MYVCLCKGIQDRRLRQVILSGASTVEEVGRRCGAGTDCGSCVEDIRSMIREIQMEGTEVHRKAS